MYPTTIITWDDQSDIRIPEISNVRTMPLYCTVFTSDKGTEEWTRISGQDWFDMYAVGNTVDFERHGQPLLQAAASIEAGAELLCKRVVATDATLANLAVVASVTTAQKQVITNANIFKDAAAINEYLGVTDGVEYTMFLKLHRPIGTDRYLISVRYPTGQTYWAMGGSGNNMTQDYLYWAANEERQYDFKPEGVEFPGVTNGNYTVSLYQYTDSTLQPGQYPTTRPTNISLIGTKIIQVQNGDGVNQTVETEPENPDAISATVSYSFKSAVGAKTIEEIKTAIDADVASDQTAAGENTTVFPLWIIYDIGRGASKKRIRITPNHQLSKTQANYFMYDIDVIESNNGFDTIHFVIDPTVTSGNSNISLQYQVDTYSNQIRAYQYNDQILAFMDVMMAATGMDEAEAIGMDLLFGTNKKNQKITGITVDTNGGVDLTISTGQLLQNGDNGFFGDHPWGHEQYGPLVAKAFAGYVVDPASNEATILTQSDEVYDTRIYDVDRYKIDMVFDANYPIIVKRAIEQLVTFREDFMYMRDLGTECNTLDLIELADFDNLKSKFCASYCTYYDIIDPYSRKQITVTMMYSMAKIMVQNLNNGRNLPIAGILHNYIITDAIRNTVAFTPAICPGLNQKEDLYDLRINYATYIDDDLVVESLYTSQTRYTQLSFANNVIAVQEVIKRIRTRCPAIRYSFIDGDDLAEYKARVEEIIAPYRPNFRTLALEYMQDAYYTENKIFYATLVVQFRDFVQTEYFKIVAIGSSVVYTSPSASSTGGTVTVP